MGYKNVLEQLRKYTRILVTGPQRSGTTIATKMIAQDLGYECILEESFDIFDLAKFVLLFHEKDHVVIQAPAMSSICHYFPGTEDNPIAVVFMCRNLDDIINSQKRIDWPNRYDQRGEDYEKSRYFYKGDIPVAAIKYRAWHEYQKKCCKLAFELDYDSLSEHPLWVGKERRVKFQPRQTVDK